MAMKIDYCISALSSVKISERKKGAETLFDLLLNTNLMNELDGDGENNWNNLFKSINKCIVKESEKLTEDIAKGKSIKMAIMQLDKCGQLVKSVAQEANSQGGVITINIFISYLYKCWETETMRKYCIEYYISVLKDYILPNENYCGQIEADDWIKIFEIIENSYKDTKHLIGLHCIHLIIKNGSKHQLPFNFLLKKFDFICNLCLSLNNSTSGSNLSAALEIFLDFTKEYMVDYRRLCCKLGEIVIQHVIGIYEIAQSQSPAKYIIIELLLLQVKLHHPMGAIETHSLAYAHNWSHWNRNLRHIYKRVVQAELYNKLKSFSNVEATNKYPAFFELGIDVFKQVFKHGGTEFTHTLMNESIDVQTAKRQRIEIGFPEILQNVESRSLSWIKITTELLKKYPELTSEDEFTSLLKLLSKILTEYKCQEICKNVCECLTVLIDVEKYHHLDSEIYQPLWSIVWDSTIRSIGLNQNIEETHALIQKLMTVGKGINPTQLLNTFISQVIKRNQHSYETLNIYCSLYGLTEIGQLSSLITRKTLINWVLNDNAANYLHEITAKVALYLTFNYWPPHSDLKSDLDIKSFENIYKINNYESDLFKNQTELLAKFESKQYIINKEAFVDLVTTIKDIEKSTYNNPSIVVNVVTFVCNLLKVFSQHTIDYGKVIIKMLNKLLVSLWEVIENYLNDKEFGINKDLWMILEQIEILFSMEYDIDLIIKNSVTVDVMRALFEVLGAEEDKETTKNRTVKKSLETRINKSKISVIKVICSYIFTNPKFSSNIRTHALTSVTDVNEFNPNIPIDYKLGIITLSYLKYYNGILDDNVLEGILKQLFSICQHKYLEYEVAIDVLDILYYLFPIMYTSANDLLLTNCASLMLPFFQYRKNYGAKVSIATANCMGEIAKIDIEGKFKWNEIDDIPPKLANLLCSPFQEVRLAAIKNIILVFSHSCTSNNNLYERQKKLFYNICTKSKKLFTESSNVEEGTIDEFTTRISNVLYTYASIMAVSSIWRQQALFEMLSIAHTKQIETDIVINILNKISIDKLASEIIERDINYLIVQWKSKDMYLNDFPYKLLHCDTPIDFYIKYITIIIPIIINEDEDELFETICNNIGKTKQELIEDAYPAILAKKLIIEANRTTSDDLKLSPADIDIGENTHKKIQKYINEEKCSEIFIRRFDDVLVNVTQLVFDLNAFQEVFHINYSIPEPNVSFISIELFKNTIKAIDCKLQQLIKIDLIDYLFIKVRNKLQQILLKLVHLIYTSNSVEDKLVYFHRYTIFLGLILPQFEANCDMNEFLIRDISHTLLNIIKAKHVEDNVLNIIACKYLNYFIDQIMPGCALYLEKFLITIVSTLVPIANCNTDLSIECLGVIKKLICDYAPNLINGIEILDPFPETNAKFAKIQEVYLKVKYGNAPYSLKEEIEHFIKAGERVIKDACRVEGLTFLRKILVTKKMDLKLLYEDLYKTKGSLDVDSVLHRLICMLVNLTSSTDANVSLEATRCLGELGPADLTTMVLKTEGKLDHLKMAPKIIATGSIISLFLEYMVDDDIELVREASAALYEIMASAEGKRILSSEDDYGYGIIEKSYLTPFIKKTNSAKSLEIKDKVFLSTMCDETIWYPQQLTNHAEWIKNLITNILNCFGESTFFNQLINVCKIKTSFAEKLLPLVMNILLNASLKNHVKILTDSIKGFFERHWDLHWDPSQGNSFEIVMQKPSVQCMLNTVHFVRTQKGVLKKYTTSAMDLELNLDYLKVAQAAQFCSAHFTALMYAELWCQNRVIHLRKSIENIPTMSVLNIICEYDEKDIANAVQAILRQAYVDIGDLDSLHGSHLINLLDPKSHINQYKNLNRWDQVVLHYDIQASHGVPNSVENQWDALKKFGLTNLASNYKVFNEPQYECMWRLGNWADLNVANQQIGANFDKNHYLALKSFHENDLTHFNEAINAARTNVIDDLKQASLESCKNLYKPLAQLKSLQELEACFRAGDNFQQIYANWKLRDSINSNEFQYTEPVIAHRIALINILVTKGKHEFKDHLVNLQLDLAEMARNSGHINVATRAVYNLQQFTDLSEAIKGKIQLENAQICWKIDRTIGTYILQDLLKTNKDPMLKALSLKLYGTWMVEMRSKSAQTIISDYFLESIAILQRLNDDNEDSQFQEAYALLARFADQQYQEVLNYTTSAVFKGKIESMEKLVDSAAKLKSAKNAKVLDVKRAGIVFQRQSAIDKTEIESTLREKNAYLSLAMKYYLHNLQHSNDNNIKMFRIISLWLENRANIEVGELLTDYVPNIPTFKILSVLPQIIPHLSSSSLDEFGKRIPQLIERCAKDHPHHALPIILEVANSNKDDDYTSDAVTTETNEPRVIAAVNLMNKLRAKPQLKQVISQMETLANALIELAYFNVKNTTTAKHAIPAKYKLKKIKQFEELMIPTYNLPIRKDGKYDNIIGIHGFENDFRLVGGVNAPKQIICVGTDGRQFMQLLKGKDDLRQDAVMQQVFTIMNGFLGANKQTSNLLIRTYKVIPLSKRSGLLEWVSNSMPFGDYLVGKEGAHRLYNKEDMSPEKCKAKFVELANEKYEVKFNKYKEICRQFHPAFHKFFETTFLHPTVWYERKRAYTHSVATSSMCGYILGLGDRHVNNILIDKNSAEVIHIDFGIAFEQGKVLPTPESVPFRLSRDIESGMGVSGVEGTFRRSCEKTMEVLRNNSETIITILEVLLYNPLYAWTITPAQAYSKQFDSSTDPMPFSDSSSDSQGNLTAERALVRVKQKLQGTENGGYTSVERQVEQLIQNAREPSNLCKLFYGWQPYL